MISDNTISVRLSADAQELQKAMSQGTGYIESFSGKATGSMRAVGAETGKLEDGMASLANGIKSAFVGSSIAVGLIGLKNMIGDVTQELVQTQIQVDKMRNGLNFAVGAENAAGEMAFLRQSAQSLGLELVSTSLMYTKLAAASRGTTLAGQQTRDVFTSIAQASTVMGLSAEQTEGALLAITQMISKGKVQAEELRGQLGERLPGAFQIAARAMGVTTGELDKMLTTGQVLATDFLPKFAKQLTMETAPALDEASKSMQASVNRMSNAWTDFKRNVNESGVGKAIQQEIMGMGNYVQAASDAMENSRVNGGNSLAQLSAGLGQMIARIPFDALSLASNGLNGSLNLLSGGALKLNTDLNLLPDSLNTNEQRIRALTTELPKAEKELVRLRAQLALQPDNIYLKSEIGQLFLFVEKAREAKSASDRLKNITTENSTQAGINASGMAREAYEKDRAASMAELLVMKTKLAGVDKDYLPTLEKLQGWRERGIVTEKEYIALVSDLASANYKADKTAKAPKDRTNAFRAEQDAAKSWADALKDAQRISDKATASTNNLNEAQARLVQYLESPAFATNSAEMREVAVSALVAASGVIELAAQKKALAKSQDELSKADAKYFEGLSKDLATQDEANHKLRESVEEIGLSTDALGALSLARMDAVIAQEQEIMTMASMHEASATELLMMQQRIDKLKEHRALTSTGISKTAAAESVKKASDEWTKFYDSIYNGLSDSLYRGFEAGKGFFQSFWDGIKNLFKTTVLKLAVQGVMGGVTGALGLTSTAANAASTGSSLLSAGSLFNSASSLGGLFASNAAYGAAIGTTSIGVGSQAAMLAAQTGSFGAAGVSATSAAAAGAGGAGSGIMGAIGAIPGWGWAAMGVAALAALSSSRFKSTESTGYGVREYDANGKMISSATDSGGIGQAAAALDGLNMNFQSVLKSLGGTGGSKFTYNSNTGREGEDPQFYIKSGSYDSGEIQKNAANVALATSRAIFAALQDSTLPKYLEGAFDGMVAGSLSAEQIDKALTGAQALKGFNDQLLALPFANLADLSFAATQNLIGFSGGLDQLKANLGAYYTSFYTQEEQRAQTIKNINAATAGSGLDAATATRESFRALVDNAMLDTSEAGLKTTASLLAVSGALAGIIPKAEDTSKALQDAASAAEKLAATNQGWADQLAVLTGAETERSIALRDAGDDATRALMRQVYAQQDLKDATQATSETLTGFIQALSDSASAASANLSAATSALQSAYQTEAALIKGTVDRFGGIAKQFAGFASSLDGGIFETPIATVDRLKADYQILTDKARLGDADAASKAVSVGAQLKDAITTQYGTSTAGALELAKLRNSAAATEAITGQQASIAQQQLDALTAQVSGFVTLNESVLSVKDAITAFRSAQQELDTVRNAYLSALGGQLASSINTGNLAGSIDTLAKNFAAFDANSNNLLTKAELTSALGTTATAEQVASLFDAIDINKNGTVNAFELTVSKLVAGLKTSTVAGAGGATYTLEDLAKGIAAMTAAGFTPAQIAAAATKDYGVAAGDLAAAAGTVSTVTGAVSSASTGDAAATAANAAATAASVAYHAAIAATSPLSNTDRDIVIGLASKRAESNGTSPQLELISWAKSNGANAGQLDKALGWALGSTNAWALANGIPSFAKGINYLPGDMLVNAHQGERIMPAADNRELMARLSSPQQNNDALVAEIRALRKEVADLRADNTRENMAIATHSANTAEATRRMDNQGVMVFTDPAAPIETKVVA